MTVNSEGSVTKTANTTGHSWTEHVTSNIKSKKWPTKWDAEHFIQIFVDDK